MKRTLTAGLMLLLAITSIATGILVARHFARSKPNHQSALKGRRLAENIDWAQSERTLVLALQVRCKYCADSIDFYRILVPAATNEGIRVVAIFPDDKSEAEHYLSASELVIPEIKQSDLGVLGITGTPTLLLVNKDGIVQKAWEGKLPLPIEKEVLKTIDKSFAR